MLGHFDPTITLSIYAHVLPDMQDATARAMDLMLGADEHPTADKPPTLSVVRDPKNERADSDAADGDTPLGDAQDTSESDASESTRACAGETSIRRTPG